MLIKYVTMMGIDKEGDTVQAQHVDDTNVVFGAMINDIPYII